MAKKRELSASLEDYLEAIHEIAAVKGAARAKDVADRLSVANSSVTNALHGLVERDLVNHASYDLISLTPKGLKVAEEIVRRHNVLKEFFVEVLALEQDIAEDCACKMEHFIPDMVMERFVEFVKCHQHGDCGRITWIEGEGFVRGETDRPETPCNQSTNRVEHT